MPGGSVFENSKKFGIRNVWEFGDVNTMIRSDCQSVMVYKLQRLLLALSHSAFVWESKVLFQQIWLLILSEQFRFEWLMFVVYIPTRMGRHKKDTYIMPTALPLRYIKICISFPWLWKNFILGKN